METAGAASRCTACGADAVVDGVCGRCGFASGSAHKCPHCGAIARVEPKGSGDSLVWVCGVCGGPRMPGGLGGEPAVAPLRQVKTLRGKATRARAASWVLALMAAFTTLVAIAAWPAAIVAKLVWMILALTPALLAVRSRAKASKALREANVSMDQAWLAAAEDAVKQSKKGVTTAELASRLKITTEKADTLLTQLAVHDRTRIDVDDDAEVRYSVSPEELAKVRVATDDAEEDPLARAIEEAAAADEAAREEAAQAAQSKKTRGVK